MNPKDIQWTYKEDENGLLLMDYPDYVVQNKYQINRWGRQWVQWIQENAPLDWNWYQMHLTVLHETMEMVSLQAQKLITETQDSILEAKGVPQMEDYVTKFNESEKARIYAVELAQKEIIFKRYRN